MDIVMAAAECRGLIKVGGLGDVVADLGRTLAEKGHRVRVIIPHYESLPSGALTFSREVSTFTVNFEGGEHMVHLSFVPLGPLEVYLLRATYFSGEYSGVYVDSASLGRGPFEDDARRFAFFSTAVYALLTQNSHWEDVEILHGHDWHLGPLMWLRNHGVQKADIVPSWKTVFTIHNMDYQGVRPFAGSLGAGVETWWPELYNNLPVKAWSGGIDPKFPQCLNLLRLGITQADRVTTVSPTYAREILLPDDSPSALVGGRGLEKDLAIRSNRGEFYGWLNGMDYHLHDPRNLTPPLILPLGDEVFTEGLFQNFLDAKAVHKSKILSQWPGKDNSKIVRPLVAMVTRVTGQKVALLLEDYQGKKVWEWLLERDLDLVILGTGDLEKELLPVGERPNARFIRAFNPALSTELFAASDLFLMPSDFEPCGISQLLAMRYGSLPLVHGRGGLADTVEEGKTGFVFGGASRSLQISSFLQALDRGLETLASPHSREILVKNALSRRFDWGQTSINYEKLYGELLAAN